MRQGLRLLRHGEPRGPQAVEGKRGRPAKGELPPEEVRALEEEAASIKGSRYALVKNPE